MDSTPLLDVRDLSKRFVIHERGEKLVAFSDVSFTACAEQLVCLVGASGSGKSSVLKCIYRTYLPSSGRIALRSSTGETIDLATAVDATILRLRRTEMRMVSQFLHVLPRRSAQQILEMALLEAGESRQACGDTAADFLRQVGLPEKLWKLPPHTFSGGEKQLVNLARALAVRPRLLLLDEPTASLDPASTERMLELIEDLKQQGLAMLAVFHNPDIVARLADSTVELSGGLNSNSGTTTIANPVEDTVA